MASQPVSATVQQESSFSVLPSLLSDAWNTGLGLFERWVDHELGLGEVALAAESDAHQVAVNQTEAPGGTAFQIGTAQFTLSTLLLVGGIGLVVLLLLRS